MSGVLEGVRVIEMGHMVAMPAASVWMADWGAEVLKIEPLSGEMFRSLGRAGSKARLAELERGEANWGVELHNRNKKSLALDLKQAPGRDILYKLIKRADVFMSNYELGTLDKLGMDYTTLRQLNPELIYAVVSGYGTVGPDRNERGFDHSAAWARSGIQNLACEPDSPPPRQPEGLGDRIAASHVVAGVCAALLHKERTGEGQKVETSLFHSGVWTLAMDIQAALVGKPLSRGARAKAINPIYNAYRTKDDRWVQLSMVWQPDSFWPGVCRAIDRPELENDPRFNTAGTRAQNSEEAVRILDEAFASRNLDECERRLREYNCIFARVETPVEITTDPQALANDFFAELNHPAGQMKVVASPVKFLQNPASVRAPAPEVGQHNEEMLSELGYSRDDIARLKKQGVIP